MSQENVEVVRRGYEAYAGGDVAATGAQSGAAIEGDFWFVHTLSDSKVTRLDMLTTKEKALEAAGLRE
jgi:ketosteroid isomerase-like protein